VCAAVSARGLSQPPPQRSGGWPRVAPPSPERSLSERLAQSQSAAEARITWVGRLSLSFERRKRPTPCWMPPPQGEAQIAYARTSTVPALSLFESTCTHAHTSPSAHLTG
jgi:hypothetical protein